MATTVIDQCTAGRSPFSSFLFLLLTAQKHLRPCMRTRAFPHTFCSTPDRPIEQGAELQTCTPPSTCRSEGRSASPPLLLFSSHNAMHSSGGGGTGARWHYPAAALRQPPPDGARGSGC
jgi:hypothetical protein